MRTLFICLFSFFLSIAFAQKAPTIAWQFDTKEDNLGTPRTDIFLLVNGKKHFITKGTGGFSELPADNFSDPNYQIPKNAISACSGFWGGLGNRLCIVPQGNVLLVQQGFLDSEANDTKIKYQTIKKIPLSPKK